MAIDNISNGTAGNDSGLFGISTTTGQITATGIFDYEAATYFTLQVLSTDGSGATDMATVNVAIGNVFERTSVTIDFTGNNFLFNPLSPSGRRG